MTSNTAGALRAGIEGVESIDVEIAELQEQLKALKAQRKQRLDMIRSETGFIPKVANQIVKERAMESQQRSAFQTQLQLARATMGMLDGTPLGDAARKAYEPKPKPSETRIDDPDQPPFAEVPDIEPVAITQEDLDVCWAAGVQAARDGQKVTENPYPADRPLERSAFDEGWCHEAGSDGMEIPDALKPKKKKKAKDSVVDRGADDDFNNEFDIDEKEAA